MKEYPKILYKTGGAELIDKDLYTVKSVYSKEEENEAIKNGFFLKVSEAKKFANMKQKIADNDVKIKEAEKCLELKDTVNPVLEKTSEPKKRRGRATSKQ